MIPIRIKDDEQYILSYSIADGKILEIRHGSLLLLWSPSNFGYLTASILIHAGAHVGGKKVYAQDSQGLAKCYDDVKKFVATYKSAPAALSYLYGCVKLALVEDGWIPESDAPAVTEPAKKEVVKDLPKSRMSRRCPAFLLPLIERLHMAPVVSPLRNFTRAPRPKSDSKPKPSTDTTSDAS
jgi:hypothetical protein